MTLSQAEKMAVKIVAEIAPFCERVEIAGSIRRRREHVNDIDLVILPKDFVKLRNRVRMNCRLEKDGEQTIVARLKNGVQLDLWIATPEKNDLFTTTPTNFGSLFLCRTGSVAHNIYLVKRAEELSMRWNPYHGVYQHGKLIASATEEEIFKALQLDFIPPERRERS